MSRWPVATFVALAIATVGAFFVTQHLKVTTPLIAGFPAPVPSAITVCACTAPSSALHSDSRYASVLPHRLAFS